MDHDVQDVAGDRTEILTGLDALRFLCSNFEIDKKQACMSKSNTFSKLYSEMQARETTITSSFTSPPPTSMLCSLRKQRKAYKPSHFPPFKEEPTPHAKPALTDDPLSLKTMSNCPTTHDNSSLSKQKSGISGKSSFNHHDNALSMMKSTEGKRNKRQNSQYAATIVCKNLACKAVILAGAPFCRRCSCCICKEFDDNKDPSLWITCDAEEQDGCGLSCHVECALQDEVAGVIKMGGPVWLDGSFFCRSCGKVSALISLWKKQLLIAKNARRVDVFCHRLFLSHRLLKGTLKYKDAHTLIDSAAKKLEVELGLMTKCSAKKLEVELGLMTKCSAKLERCIVNRLSCNPEVQNMIDLALESVENLCDARSVIVDAENPATCEKALCTMQFEDACSSSIVVVAVDNHPCDDRLGYKLWHRKATDPSYPAAPTYTIQSTSKKVLVSNLQPHTLYAFKMAPFSIGCDGEECEAECCTEGMESMVIGNHGDDGISDSMRGITNGETENVQNLKQHRTEKRGVPMEDLSNVTAPEVYEGKDNHSMEDLGTGLTIANEEQESSRRVVCETAELLKVTNTHEELENQKEEVFVLRNAFESSPPGMAMAANVEIMDDRNAASQSWAMQLLCNGTQGGNLTVSGNAKDNPPPDNCKVGLYNMEFSIRVIRWLECEGHLEKEFRKKFLTWYSLRATEHEKRVVTVFIDTLQDNAASLAAQLVDTFQDVINTKKQRVTEIGYYRRRYK